MAGDGFCALDDVETELRQPVPTNLESFAERHIVSTSDYLRMMFRREDKDLDILIDGVGEVDDVDGSVVSPAVKPDTVLGRAVRDAVARSVANELSKRVAMSESSTDLSSFSQFSEGAGGYTFSGTFNGVQQDIWFSDSSMRMLGLGRPNAGRVSL